MGDFSIQNFNVFISHSCEKSEEYNRFQAMITDCASFSFKNISRPQGKDVDHCSDEDSIQELENQIKSTHLVIILSGMYPNHSKWIDLEMKLAKEADMPMIGIRSCEALRVPSLVSKNVTELVRWNTKSIINSIRRNSL